MTTTTFRARVVIGADGIWSPVRTMLFGSGAAGPRCSGKVMYRAVLPAGSVKNPPPRGHNVTHQGDEEGKAFHHRETAEGILTVTSMARIDRGDDNAGAPAESGWDLAPEERKRRMMEEFADFPAEVQNVLDNIPPEAVHVDVIHDIDVLERWSKGRLVLIGDAAHAMSPSLGQGANQGLEDACVLVHSLVSHPSSPCLGAKVRKEEEARTIPYLLDQYWQGRIDRVKRVHAASRARSKQNNLSTKSRPIDMSSTELKEVLEEIQNWEAPIDVAL